MTIHGPRLGVRVEGIVLQADVEYLMVDAAGRTLYLPIKALNGQTLLQEVEDDLWETATDRYGNTFFWNPRTRETRWDDPREDTVSREAAAETARRQALAADRRRAQDEAEMMAAIAAVEAAERKEQQEAEERRRVIRAAEEGAAEERRRRDERRREQLETDALIAKMLSEDLQRVQSVHEYSPQGPI
eukprot:TRINITY_DN22352_c0_g1_i2.p1 TRINITY_DN22352_c0_g1~~TRINITY_DN22352_c0_g1_i2.p1  ORF type:complete len:188 (+),score=43.09 TRINITY_DN22352_c0_g1_i2:325-888(+)